MACALPRRAAGFTYLGILFIVAIMGAGLALVSEVWHTAAMRDKEAELLYAGHQYRKAIERYYLAGRNQYPRTLEALLKDPRMPGTERYLRKLYPDPITGKDWVLVRSGDDAIMGVRSASDEQPIKAANFKLRDAGFERAAKYSEWAFVFVPAAAPAPAAPKPATPKPAAPQPAAMPESPR
jgi:type II secretory pathway pseudopilin PulG